MFEVKIHENKAGNYYNFTLVSADKSHYLNIYISQRDNYIDVSISTSEDGFYFKNPYTEANDIELNSTNSIEETYDSIKNYFINKGYNLYTF